MSSRTCLNGGFRPIIMPKREWRAPTHNTRKNTPHRQFSSLKNPMPFRNQRIGVGGRRPIVMKGYSMMIKNKKPKTRKKMKPSVFPIGPLNYSPILSKSRHSRRR
jgi:hypothetical protein